MPSLALERRRSPLMEQILKHAPDGAIAGAALSVPLWMQSVDAWSQLAIFLGGVVLIGIRIAIAVRDLRRNR